MSQPHISSLASALGSVGLVLALIAGSQDTERASAKADVMKVEIFNAEEKLITSATVALQAQASVPVQVIREVPYTSECSTNRTPSCTTSTVEEGVRIELTRVSDQMLNVDINQTGLLSMESFTADGRTIELPKLRSNASSFALDFTNSTSQARPLPGGGKVVITAQPH